MEIKRFTMRVTPEQSRIVQKIMFKNEYRWAGGENEDPIYLNDQTEGFYKYLILEEDSKNNPVKLVLRCSMDEVPTITFNEFLNKYDLKHVRNSKLKKLQHEN